MINIKTLLSIFLVTCCAIISIPARATVVDIDLNDFFADPTAVVAVDGSTATLTEDITFPSVLLSNDPGLGDPNVIIPSAGALLKFEFDFTEGASNDDEFFADVLDEFGFSILGFSTSDTDSGTVSFDISAFLGQTIGLQFELAAFDLDLDSTLTISDVRIETPDIPLPPVTGLMFMGFIWLNIIRRRRMVN